MHEPTALAADDPLGHGGAPAKRPAAEGEPCNRTTRSSSAPARPGPSLAKRLAGAGQRVAIIERKAFGGTCINTGCTPTKTLVASAYAAHMARRAAEFGVVVSGGVVGGHAAGEAAQGRHRRVMECRDRGVAARDGELHGVSRPCPVRRAPRDRGRRRTARARSASSSTSAAGQRCRRSPASTRVPYLTNTTALELDAVPEHLVILGGSYIGLEFAQIFRRFGAEVTVLETAPRLVRARGRGNLGRNPRLPGERRRAHRLRRPRLRAWRTAQRGVEVSVTDAGSRSVDRRLASAAGGRHAGRTPTIWGSIAPVSRSMPAAIITVDEQLRTNVPGIWALGDCNGRGAFTHTSLQRLRDRRRQSAGWRGKDGERPHRRLCAVYRPAARPRRDDRDGGAPVRPQRCWSPAWRWRTWRAPSRRARPRG